jgi:sugar phosphate isomerase/epimerase
LPAALFLAPASDDGGRAVQLGFVSAILPDATLEQVLGTAAELGYDCVELMCWPAGKAERRYAGVTHMDVTEFTDADAANVRRQAAAAGVAISGLGYYPNPLAPDPAEAGRAVEHLRRVIHAAALLGVGLVNTFVGRDPCRSVEDNWPRFLEVWRPLVRHAEEHGVRIGIENCPMLFTRDEWPGGKNLAVSPAIWRRMFADIPSPTFGLNYDPSHLVWQQMDPVRPLREFRERLFHVHAKDVRLDRERLDEAGILATPLEYHTPKLPGLGEVDWGRFFSVLGDAGYRGPVCLEVEDRAYEGSPEARRAALRQGVTYLRNFIPAPGRR